jgi:hypothetical protein
VTYADLLTDKQNKICQNLCTRSDFYSTQADLCARKEKSGGAQQLLWATTMPIFWASRKKERGDRIDKRRFLSCKMRENQLPVFAARWQHGSQICNFYLVKYHKNAKNLTTTKAKEKIGRFGIFRFLEKEI